MVSARRRWPVTSEPNVSRLHAVRSEMCLWHDNKSCIAPFFLTRCYETHPGLLASPSSHTAAVKPDIKSHFAWLMVLRTGSGGMLSVDMGR